MLAVYYITENKTKYPYKDCIIFCLYYYVFRTLLKIIAIGEIWVPQI